MDISAFIVGLGVMLVIAASEFSGKKNKKEVRKAPLTRRAPANASAQRQTASPVPPKRKPQTPKQPSVRPPERKPFLSGNEGVRVTHSEKTLQTPTARQTVKKVSPGLCPLTRDKLRDAVIWSEILRPKF